MTKNALPAPVAVEDIDGLPVTVELDRYGVVELRVGRALAEFPLMHDDGGGVWGPRGTDITAGRAALAQLHAAIGELLALDELPH